MASAARVLAFALAILMAPAAFGQKANGPLESRLVARKVAMVDGRETLLDAADAKPGDLIEYAATYRNSGRTTLRDLAATLPIPEGTEYVAGSPRPANALASTDGALFAAIPLRLEAPAAGANAGAMDVPPRDYRAIRWHAGELAAGASVSVRVRVRVLDEGATLLAPAQGP